VDDTPDIEIDLVSDLAGVLVKEGARASCPASVVHQHVDVAKAIDAARDEFLDGLRLRDVCSDNECLDILLADEFGDALALIDVRIGKDDVATLGCETERESASEPAA
jgi:hypothetical protein